MRRGEEWGSAASGPPDLEVSGRDADLARAVGAAWPGVLVRFRPEQGSELARALGLSAAAVGNTAVGNTAVSLDALRLDGGQPDGGQLAVNGIVVGVAPDRLRSWHRAVAVEVTVDGQSSQLVATSVVVMNGQFWREADLSPRGHPGDGVLEVAVYGLRPGARRAMRGRLAQGAHLPHPEITVRRGRKVTVRFARDMGLEIDGQPSGRRVTAVEVEVVPGAYRLLV